MRYLNGLVGLALLGISSVAVAGEPTKLSNAALDSVTGGVWNTFTLALTTPAGTQGASSSISQISRVSSSQQVQLTPPNFSGSVFVTAQAQSIAQVSGIGQTGAFGGGSVLTGVAPAN